MDDCIFCKIVGGEIPGTIVYEDDRCLAFEDANPQMPVHTLIVPKEHYASLADDVPADLLGHLFSVVPKVAQIKGIADSGYRTIVNTGGDAAQTVKHLHIHVCGGEPMKEGMF